MVKSWVAAGVAAVVLLFVTPAVMHTPARSSGEPPPFDTWRAALVEEAVDRGFTRRFAEETLATVEPLPRVVELDREQAQAPPDLDAYLAQRVTPELIARGREMVRRHGPVLAEIERAFGVQKQFLVAIWGAETGYGTYTGDVAVLQALVTLAWEPRRAPYFRSQLFAALAIVRDGHIAHDAMTGSWAGAMGQPQFMPSSYREYAVDFDRDGRRDIWTSEADTLASIANYLQRFGWQAGGGWGMDVMATPTVRSRVAQEIQSRSSGCGAIRALTERRPLVEWSAYGIRAPENAALPPRSTDASLLVVDDRAFLVSPNYETILAYNCSHRYALSVALLADRLR